MRVLDLFAGLEGWSQPFRERGHDVISLDNDPRFGCDITADLLDWNPKDLPWRPDIVLASPPCEAFSVMSIGTHWGGGKRAYEPMTDGARLGMALVRRTIGVILETGPMLWVIENPRGVLRKLDLIPIEPETIWACHFGMDWAKPTDLWHNLPNFETRGKCHNQRREHPSYCCCHDHISAVRGSRTGVQGEGPPKSIRPGSLQNTKHELREYWGTSNQRELSALRAKIPYDLATQVCYLAEGAILERKIA